MSIIICIIYNIMSCFVILTTDILRISNRRKIKLDLTKEDICINGDGMLTCPKFCSKNIRYKYIWDVFIQDKLYKNETYYSYKISINNRRDLLDESEYMLEMLKRNKNAVKYIKVDKLKYLDIIGIVSFNGDLIRFIDFDYLLYNYKSEFDDIMKTVVINNGLSLRYIKKHISSSSKKMEILKNAFVQNKEAVRYMKQIEIEEIINLIKLSDSYYNLLNKNAKLIKYMKVKYICDDKFVKICLKVPYYRKYIKKTQLWLFKVYGDKNFFKNKTNITRRNSF